MSDQHLISLETDWKKQTGTANGAFQKGFYDEAIRTYKDTMEYAKRLTDYRERCMNLNIPFVQIFIISCNNLANTYEESGQLEEASKLLLRTIYFVQHLFKELDKDQVEEQRLHSELKRATLAYCNFCQIRKLKADVAIMEIHSQLNS